MKSFAFAVLIFPVFLSFFAPRMLLSPASQSVKPKPESSSVLLPDTLRALLCEGEGIVVGANLYDQQGTYLDTLVSSQGIDSVVVTIVEALPDVTVAAATVSICVGDSMELMAQNATAYSWTPGAGLSDTSAANPLAFPVQTTTYYVSAVSYSDNLVVNGDFEAGNTGFFSQYIYEQGPVMQPGMYFVGSEPEISHPNFEACNDHTTGSGNMLFANATIFPDLPVVWEQSVSLTPNSEYLFSVWVQNVTTTQVFLPEMQFFINGVQVAPAFLPDSTQCKWTNFTTTWNSGSNTSALITIIDQNLTSPGNDFGLDDISLRKICTTQDSVTVHVFSHFFKTVNATICQGESYQLPGGSPVTSAGVFTDTLTTQNGCDSVVETSLSVLPVAIFDQNIVLCEGETVMVGSNAYGQPGAYLDTLQAANGCDSIVTTNVTVNPAPVVNLSPVICEGESVTVGSNVYTQTGTYTDIFQTWLGCDSTVVTMLTVNPVFSTTQSPTICEGQSFTTGASTYSQPGVYLDTLQTVSGCDSIVATNLTVIPSSPIQLSFTICEGESVAIGSSVYTQPGIYQDTLATNASCDSIITTTIVVNPSPTTLQAFTICEGETISVNGNVYTQTGTYTDVFQTMQGCDSTVVTTLTVLPDIVISQSVTLCEGETVGVGGSTYSQSGNYTDLLQSWQGCDSTVQTSLTVIPAVFENIDAAICEGEIFQLGSEVYTQTGVFQDTLQGWQGCDSIVTLTLSVTSLAATLAVVPPICFGETNGSVTATGVSGGLTPFLFSLNNQAFFTADSLFENLPAGVHELWVEDAAGCRKAFPFVLNGPQELALTLPPSLEIELGGSVQLNPALNFVPDSIVWTSEGNLSCQNCLRPTARPFETAAYRLWLQDANGCTIEGQVEILVRRALGVFVPNVFSPNGDGLNDRFTVFAGPSVQQIRQFLIFNRWGAEVFRAENFLPNDPAPGWDGMFKGKPAGQGVFTWLAEVEYIGGERRIFAGDVILMK